MNAISKAGKTRKPTAAKGQMAIILSTTDLREILGEERSREVEQVFAEKSGNDTLHRLWTEGADTEPFTPEEAKRLRDAAHAGPGVQLCLWISW